MLKRGDKGQAVVDLQKMIEGCGYPLTRWGADGDLGGETLDALSLLLHDYYPAYKDEDRKSVSDRELDFVRQLYERLQHTSDAPAIAEWNDLRQTAARVHDRGPRQWHSIDAITMHQTACLMGNKPARYNTLGAHIGVMRNGGANFVHEFDRIVWHGNLFNKRSIGFEVDGLYAGKHGDMKTVWDDPSTARREQPVELTAESRETTKELVRWSKARLEARGATLRYLFAHRQSSKDRRNDPGEQIWKEIVLPISAELGLTAGAIGYSVGGYPIPEVWDGRCKGYSY